MQYDLARAKGGILDEDHKVEEEKKKAKAEKEEKTTAVTVKVEIKLPESAAAAEKAVDPAGAKASPEGEGDKFEDAAESLDAAGGQKTDGQESGEVKKALELRPKDQPGSAPSEGPSVPSDSVKDAKSTSGDKAQSEKKEQNVEKKEDKVPETEGAKVAPEPEKTPDSEDKDKDEKEEQEEEARWNAVCVTCLRVYSQRPRSRHLVGAGPPQTIQEASSSLVQGQEPAGATQ